MRLGLLFYYRVGRDQSVRRYLEPARKRFNAQLDGFELDPEDVYAMQMMCAYEVDGLLVQVYENGLLTNDGARLSRSDIPSSASSSLSKSGKDLITRRDYGPIRCFTSH